MDCCRDGARSNAQQLRARSNIIGCVSRYYFHVVDDLDTTDEEGTELPDAEAARLWAVNASRILMCETLREDGKITLHHRIEIEDDQGAVVRAVEFGDAVEIID